MPITRELTPQELQALDEQGIDSDAYKGKQVTLATDDEVAKMQPPAPSVQQQPLSATKAILDTQKARAGGTLGGGLSAIGGGALAAEYLPLAHVAPPYSEAIAGILGATAGGFGGSMAGQKLQNTIQGPQLTQELQQKAEEGEQAYPKTTAATDILASALASGGKFNLSNIPKALSGDGQAIGKIALNSLVNPAINTGLGYATTGQLPTAKDLLTQAAGGALFSEQAKWAGKITGHGGIEPAPEANAKEPNQGGVPASEVSTVNGPYQEPGLISDEQVISNYKGLLNKTPKRSDYGADSQGYVDYSLARNKWAAGNDLSPDEMRDALHTKWMSDLAGSTSTANEPVVKLPSNPESPVESVSAKQPTEQVVPAQSEQTENLTAANKDTKPPEPSVPLTAKEADYQKMMAEKVSQQHEDTENPLKPITENQARIINPETLVSGSDVTRPESFDRSQYLPPNKPSEDDVNNYNSKYSQMKDMVAKGQAHTPEFMSLWKELEGIKNKNGRMPPTREIPNKIPLQPIVPNDNKALSKHIKTGKATVGSALDIISKTQDSKWAPLAKYMIGSSSQDRLNVPIHPDITPEMRAAGKRSNYGYPDAIYLEPHVHNNDYAVTHESLHALSSKFIDNNPNHPLTKQLEGLRQLAENHIGKSEYGTKDLHEFLAMSMGDERFQQKLDSIKIPGDSRRTVWDKVVGFVKSVLGIPDSHSTLLEKALKTSDSLIKEASGAKGDGEGSGVREAPYNWGDMAKSRNPNRNGADETGGEPLITFNDMSPKESMLLKIRQHFGNDEQADKFIKSLNLDKIHELPPTTTKGKEEEKQVTLNTNRLGKVGKLFEPILDKIRDLKTKSSGELADAAQKAYQHKDELVGQTTNKLVRSRKDLNLSSKDSDALWKVADNANKNGVIDTRGLTPQQKQYLNLNRNIHDTQGQEQLKDQEPVMRGGKPTSLRLDPAHFPTTMEPKVQEIIKNNTDNEAIEKYHQDYLKNADAFGYGKEVAEKKWGLLLDAVRGGINEHGANMQHFNAVRREQGLPLPPSMRRSDFFQNDEAYYNRRATDRAFFNNIEKNSSVWASLGNNKDSWNRPIPHTGANNIASTEPVRAMLKEWTGDFSGQLSRDEKAISAAATTGMIAGPPLEVHKIGSNYVTVAASMADHPLQLLGQLHHIISNMTSSIQHAEDNGIIKLTNRSLNDFNKANATFSEKLQALTQGWRQLATIGGLTDKISTGLLQGGFEWGLNNKIQKANQGSVTDQQFIKKLDPSYTVGKVYGEGEISKLASVAAGFAHGTHDARTMPAWMSGDSELSGFFKLAHWSVSQTNRFMSDIYTPATKGDFKPLIMNMFGAAIGGYLIKEIREKMQGKTGQIPSLQDISSSEKGLQGNIPLVAYNMIAAMQYAGFAGMLSQVARYPFDIAYKNNPQGATFPLDEIGSDVLSTVKNIAGAAANDPNFDWSEAAVKVASHLATQNVAMGRMSYNQLANNGLLTNEQNEKQSKVLKEAELRKFQMSNGFPYDEQSQDSANPYMNLEQKKFKNTQDIKEAAGMLPGLVSNIIQNYHDKPDVMLEKLKALKGSEYNTMPNPENMPLEFGKYIQYINRRQGPEAAQAAIQDYFRHKAINEAKSSMVP